MKHRRPPRWPRCLALSVLLLLTACRSGATPPGDPGTPSFLRPSPGRPTIRGTAVLPRATTVPSATPTGPDLSPAAATLLVEQAVGLLLDYSLNHPASADLYQAAYDGAILHLARSGLLADRALPPFSGERGDDAPIFRALYGALADEVGPRGGQRALAYAAIRAAVERADQCRTYFLDPEALRAERAGLPADGYGGIGVGLRGQGSPVAIETVYADSPAALAGLRPDDRILAVDGTAATALDAAALAARLRGEAGATLQLTILRPGEAVPRTVAVVRAPVRPPPFSATLLAAGDGPPIAYLRLSRIDGETIPPLREALADLARGEPRGWVLDLRGGEVGPIELLPDLAGLLLPAGTPVGYVVNGAGEAPIVATGRLGRPPGPLAVLTDSGTALLGEALAAAAHDAGDARLFGEATAGCAATSALYPLADGAGLRITLDPLLSPRRRPLHERGQRPDETILPDSTGATDRVLAAALRWAGSRGRWAVDGGQTGIGHPPSAKRTLPRDCDSTPWHPACRGKPGIWRAL